MRHDTTPQEIAIQDLSGSLERNFGGDCYDCATALIEHSDRLGQDCEEAEDDIILLAKQIIRAKKHNNGIINMMTPDSDRIRIIKRAISEIAIAGHCSDPYDIYETIIMHADAIGATWQEAEQDLLIAAEGIRESRRSAGITTAEQALSQAATTLCDSYKELTRARSDNKINLLTAARDAYTAAQDALTAAQARLTTLTN